MSSGHVSRVRKLYKLILRLHRSLPDDLRVLGDLYAREEFQRHKACKPDEARTFLSEWQDYAATMLRQAAPARVQRPAQRQVREADVPEPGVHSHNFGKNLPLETYEKVSPDQLFNLYMLLVNSGGHLAHEPIDAGIELSEADKFAVKASEAKKYISQLEKVRKERVARGQLREDFSFDAGAWIDLLDLAIDDKDKAAKVQEKAEQKAEERTEMLVKNKAKKDEKEE